MSPVAESASNSKKAARKAATGKPFKKGDKRINRSKPGTGRPPDAFKAMCRELASSKDTETAVKEILKNSKHPAYIGALKWASEHGYGKPDQPVTGAGGGPLTVKVVFSNE